jgi:hypothetical protein
MGASIYSGTSGYEGDPPVMKTLAPLAALLLLGARQDEAVPLKWAVSKEDRFEMKWSFSDIKHSETGKSAGGTGGTSESADKREVEAELALKETDGILGITLKKVVWSLNTNDHEITITYTEAKKNADVQVKVKGDPKASAGAKVGLKQAADLYADQMRKAVAEGEYSINISERAIVCLYNGVPARASATLLDRIYLHSPLPVGGVKPSFSWKEPVEGINLPTGLVELKMIEVKPGAINDKSATVRAGVNIPINKPGTVTNQKTTGSFVYSREYVFGRDGYLHSSKEETTFTKKVDATGKDAEFYKENTTFTTKQSVQIKKKAPPKDDKKPDERKPLEKPAGNAEK